MNETATKPKYLGLLNTISLAESRAGVYLKAWADVTPDAELRRCLALVAARETSHGEVFRQRIERLGFSLREREDPGFAEQLRVYGDPSLSDLEKVRYGRRSEEAGDGGARPDPFAGIEAQMQDGSMDALTRDTLRWYIHEERDSGELLKQAYACIEAKAGGLPSSNGAGSAAAPTPTVSADAQAIMACMSDGFAALQRSIRELTDAMGKRDKHK